MARKLPNIPLGAIMGLVTGTAGLGVAGYLVYNGVYSGAAK